MVENKPIFRCTEDEDRLVSLQDCEQCKTPCLPLPAIRMVADYETREHAYHGKPGRYSVTELIGCLRAAALKRLGALALEAPVRLLGRTMGSVLHEKLEDYTDDYSASEVELTLDRGSHFMRGTIDLLFDDNSIIDYKFTSSVPKRIKPDHLKQLRAYRAMHGSEFHPTAAAWYMAFNGVACHRIDNDPDKDKEVLDWLLERMKRLHAAVEAGDPDRLEPEGRDRRFGPKKTLCDYCPVRTECEAGNSRLPF